MKMNIYLPDDLGARVKDAAVNVSSICQAALAAELIQKATPDAGHLDGDQLHGRACIYCGSTDRRSLVLAFFGGKVELACCTPACDIEAAERRIAEVWAEA